MVYKYSDHHNWLLIRVIGDSSELPKAVFRRLYASNFEPVLKYFLSLFLKCKKVTPQCFEMRCGRLRTGKKKYFQFRWRGHFVHICQPLPKITKMAAISLKSIIGTCNKKQTPQSLGQSTTLTCCQPSWMSAITENHKNGYHFSKIDDRDLQ